MLCGGHGTLNDKYINKCIVQENSTEYMILSININKQFIFILFVYTCHNWFLQSQLRHVKHEVYETIVNECLINVSSAPLTIPCVCSQKLINRNGGLFCLPDQIMSFPFRLIWVQRVTGRDEFILHSMKATARTCCQEAGIFNMQQECGQRKKKHYALKTLARVIYI